MNSLDYENNFIICDELLLLILQYVGKYRQSASLVCKKFYKLNCEIEKNKIPLKIKNEWLESVDIYNSIVNSSRIFNSINLDTNKLSSLISFWRLKQIFYVHGENIKKLVWDSCKLTRVEVITLLNLLPNLVTLECSSWKFESEYFDESCETLAISNLKELKIVKCNKSTEEFFLKHLPNNILHSLSSDFDSCQILENQVNVKILDLNVEILQHNNLAHLPTLTHLTMMLRRYNSDGYQILHSLLPFQTNIIYLDLLKCEGIFDGDNESFVCICNIISLETLKINVDGLSEKIFKENFYRLANLKELEIESVEHDYSPLVDIIEDLSKIYFTNLLTLRIDVECVGVPIDRIERFGQNFKNLKKFTLKCNMPLSLDSFLKHLKSLERITIDYHYNREFSKICNDYNENQTYGNIKHVELQGFNFGSEINWNEASLIKLIKMLPNLETLDVDINLPLNIKLFSNILSKLPKLKSIQSLYMVQSGDHYEKFDIEFIKNLIKTSEILKKFSIELKLKVVDIDVTQMKQILSQEFKFSMRKYGNFVVISLIK